MARAVDPESLLLRVDASWVRFWAAQAKLAPAAMAARDRTTGWSVKDIVTHVARWEAVAAKIIRAQLAGTLTAADLSEYDDDDRLNARWLRADRKLTVSQARARCRGTHRRLRTLLARLTPDQWADRRVHEWATQSTFRHYTGHARDIPRRA
jgi:hypothetical protein